MSEDRTEESKWKEVFPEKEVTSHKEKGVASGGLKKTPILRRSRTLPPKEFDVDPPKLRRTVSSGSQVENKKSLTIEQMKEMSKEEIIIPIFKNNKVVEKDEELQSPVKTTAKEVLKMDEKQLEDEVDNLFDTDDEEFFQENNIVKVDDYSKYEKKHDLICAYNFLVELFPERGLGAIFGYLGIEDY